MADERAKKPKRIVGKIQLKLDFIRVATTVEDCRELFPLRERILRAVGRIMKDHPCTTVIETGVRRAPKGLIYLDEAADPLGATDNGGER